MSEFYSNFNYKRYNKTGPSLQSPGEDAYAMRGMVIQFIHIPTGNVVNFKAFLTAFNESYTPTWTTEEVLGRMDPIYLFKDTRRTISLAFKVPAVSKSEAYENLGKVQLLAQFLYPTFKDPAQAQTIVQSPLVRIKMMNIIRNTNNLEFNNEQTNPELYNQYDMAGTGLLGTISNVTLNHNLDGNHGVIEKSNKEGLQALLPRLIEVNMDFAPVHEHPLGWDENDKFGQFNEDNGELFPYGVALSDNSNKSALDLQAEEAQTPDIPPDDADALDAEDGDLDPSETPAANDDDMNNGGSQEASAAQARSRHWIPGHPNNWISALKSDVFEDRDAEFDLSDYSTMGDRRELDPGSMFTAEEKARMAEED